MIGKDGRGTAPYALVAISIVASFTTGSARDPFLAHLAIFYVLQRKQVLEGPRILWLAVETGFPFRLIVVVQLFAFRRNVAFRSFTMTPIDDFAVGELNPA